MNRREFIGTSVLASTTLSTAAVTASAEKSTASDPVPFKLRYAPSLGRFTAHAGKDPIDQIKFMHEQGFRAFFDNGLMNKDPGLQEKIAKAAQERDMLIGPFVAYADFKSKSFVMPSRSVKRMLTDKIKKAVETCKRTSAKWVLMVPGRYDESLEWGYQTANVIDNLKYCAETLEGTDIEIVIEPLNPHNHPGLFLTKMPQAFQICQAVGSQHCKIVDDFYHQQITEGNLIYNVDQAWSQIGAFHIGDVPGRKEPTTGEINYKNVFKHLYQKKFEGALCCEHGFSKKGKEGEAAFIVAYRACDDFEI